MYDNAHDSVLLKSLSVPVLLYSEFWKISRHIPGTNGDLLGVPPLMFAVEFAYTLRGLHQWDVPSTREWTCEVVSNYLSKSR